VGPRGDRKLPMGAGEAPFAVAERPRTPHRLTGLPQPPAAECFGRFDRQSVGISNCR
jgi:hypothetical protein